MKSREVTNGMECYYHPSNNWEGSMRRGCRAVVVNAAPGNWFLNRRTGEWELNQPRGQEVLVDLYGDPYGRDPWHAPAKATRKPVTLASLRGPWEETKTRHARLIQAMEDSDRAEKDRRKEAVIRCERAVELLATLGIKASTEGMYGGQPRLVVADQDAITHLTSGVQYLADLHWSVAESTRKI